MAVGTPGPALAQMVMLLLLNNIIVEINLLETGAAAAGRD
jgi:hypothetical protein